MYRPFKALSISASLALLLSAVASGQGPVEPYYALTIDGIPRPIVNGAVIVDGIPHPIQDNGTVNVDGVSRLPIPTGKTVVDGVPHPQVDSRPVIDHVPQVTLPSGAEIVNGDRRPPYQSITDAVMKRIKDAPIDDSSAYSDPTSRPAQ